MCHQRASSLGLTIRLFISGVNTRVTMRQAPSEARQGCYWTFHSSAARTQRMRTLLRAALLIPLLWLAGCKRDRPLFKQSG